MNRIPFNPCQGVVEKIAFGWIDLVVKVRGAKYATRHFTKKGSFSSYKGHEIRFITVMLQKCLSYTPIDSIILEQSVNTNNNYKELCDATSFQVSVVTWSVLLLLRVRHSNKPFPSSCLPSLQSESKCEVFVMVIILLYIWMKTNFHKKNFASRVALKRRQTMNSEMAY